MKNELANSAAGGKEQLSRLDSLIKESYSICTFAELPQSHQMAIIWYMVVDGCAWDSAKFEDENEEDLKALLPTLIPDFVEAHGERLFGYANLAVDALKSAVIQDPEIMDSHKTWDEYHSWYLKGGGIPAHSSTDPWPVILSSDNEETMVDGWHRFHSYVRDGARHIPAVFFPEEHHIALGLTGGEHSNDTDRPASKKRNRKNEIDGFEP